jgi:hypothetical protein
METNAEQYPYVERFEALTKIYLELSLPVGAAVKAAKADLC